MKLYIKSNNLGLPQRYHEEDTKGVGPETLTYNEFDEGDQLIWTLQAVCDELGIEEETTQIGWIGTDYFYKDGEELASISIEDEADILFDFWMLSNTEKSFKNKVKEWMKDLCNL